MLFTDSSCLQTGMSFANFESVVCLSVDLVLGLESVSVKVKESSRRAQFRVVIKWPLDDCPINLPFDIYFSTISDTAGMIAGSTHYKQ